MFGISKKVLIVLLNSIVNASNHTNWVFLSNQKWEIQSTLINLHPNEYSQELHYYAVELDKCVGSWNTLNDLRKKVSVPNKTKDISYKCKCKSMEENLIQINGVAIINVDVSVWNIIYVKKIIFGIPLHVIVKMRNIWQVLLTIQWLRVMKL